MVPFSALPVGCMFSCNGVVYEKRSTRTADSFRDGWFYFRKTEMCRLLVSPQEMTRHSVHPLTPQDFEKTGMVHKVLTLGARSARLK